jgi:ribulose-phosphate 3-epimerase
MKAGIAIKPKTSVESFLPYADLVDMVLVMTVEPGFGGQSFMHDCIDKVRVIRQKYPNLDIQVDGGLALDTIEVAAEAGANVIVAGTSIFKAEDPKFVIQKFKDVVNSHN